MKGHDLTWFWCCGDNQVYIVLGLSCCHEVLSWPTEKGRIKNFLCTLLHKVVLILCSTCIFNVWPLVLWCAIHIIVLRSAPPGSRCCYNKKLTIHWIGGPSFSAAKRQGKITIPTIIFLCVISVILAKIWKIEVKYRWKTKWLNMTGNKLPSFNVLSL